MLGSDVDVEVDSPFTIPTVLVAVAEAVVDAVATADAFASLGLWAPQGLSALQASWHVLFDGAHAAMHCEPYSVQMKYGRVRENSLALGEAPLEQMQEYSRVV